MEPSSQTIRPRSMVIQGDFSLLAGDIRLPSLIYERRGQNGNWRLSIYTPVYWVDHSNTVHEVKLKDGEWKAWLDSLGPRILESWQNEQSAEQKLVVSITLGEMPPKSKLTFAPETDKHSAPLTRIVEDVTGISGGQELPSILPRKANDAQFVFLKLSLQKI